MKGLVFFKKKMALWILKMQLRILHMHRKYTATFINRIACFFPKRVRCTFWCTHFSSRWTPIESQSCLLFYSPGVYNLPEKIKSCAWSSLQYPSEFSIIFKVVYFRQCISLGGTVWSLTWSRWGCMCLRTVGAYRSVCALIHSACYRRNYETGKENRGCHCFLSEVICCTQTVISK